MYDEMRSERLPSRTDVRWFHAATVTDTTSPPLIIPSVGRDAAVSVTPGTAALVQYTMSSYAAIEGDTAIWHEWDEGEVAAAATSMIDGSVTALRLVSTGASNWEVSV